MTPSPQPLNASSPQPFSGVFDGKKVWLSGVSGFKGSWLAEWLLSLGARVHGFSLPPPTSPSLFEQLGLASRITWDCDDLRDADAVKQSLLSAQPDFVFHLAAQPLVRLSYREPVETWQTNVMGTINVLEALRALRRQDVEELSESLPSAIIPPPSAISSPSSADLSASQPFSVSAFPPPPPVVAVMITTDKCYENREWLHGYREEDPLGGHDPYSSSKAACELAIASWRRSFFSSPQPLNSSSAPSAFHFPLSTFPSAPPALIASARAGNVIGGGDWAEDRIVPDCIRSLQNGEAIPVRNKTATRPWQHVLEPLSGYLLLAAKMAATLRKGEEEKLNADLPTTSQPLNPSSSLDPSPCHLPVELKGEELEKLRGNDPSSDLSAFQLFSVSAFSSSSPQPAALCSAFNFGPALNSNRTVAEIVQEILKHWPGEWQDKSDPHASHEAGKLNLATDKAFHLLGWQPRWDFPTTIEKTVAWYRAAKSCSSSEEFSALTRRQIEEYHDGE